MSTSPLAAGSPAPDRATYRAFYLDATQRVRSARILRAGTDAEARIIARTLASAYGVELWERDRFLATYPPRRPAAASERRRLAERT